MEEDEEKVEGQKAGQINDSRYTNHDHTSLQVMECSLATMQ